jgi:hypothetical protein
MSITAKITALNDADLSKLGDKVADLQRQIDAALAARAAVESAQMSAWESGLNNILTALETQKQRST